MDYYDSSQLFKKAMERLNERVKELSCLYQVIEVLKDDRAPIEKVFKDILAIIPPGWQYPSVCEARIQYENESYATPLFRDTQWKQSADLVVDNNIVGKIEVVYTQLIREVNRSQFFPEEQKLLTTIADRISDHIFFRRLRKSMSLINAGAEKPNEDTEPILVASSDEHWKWRMHMAELIAKNLDADRFGVKKAYVIGSTKNATSGPGSDIDLLIHWTPTDKRRCELNAWLEGWSLCLAEMNFHRTGYASNGLLDVHYITDEDIVNKTSFACMIDAVTDPARLLTIKHSRTKK